jgi:hypothetical protein
VSALALGALFALGALAWFGEGAYTAAALLWGAGVIAAHLPDAVSINVCAGGHEREPEPEVRPAAQHEGWGRR